MITLRMRPVVSLVVLGASLSLAACAHAPAQSVAASPAAAAPTPSTVRFDNDALDPVDVYLRVEGREWMLGRVQPGARASLRLPAAALSTAPAFMQIAVVPRERGVPVSARGEQAMLTFAQPPASLLTQRWTFADGELRSQRLPATSAVAGRP